MTLQFNQSAPHLIAVLEQHGPDAVAALYPAPDGADEVDRDDYQTLFATHAGAVAAPTAGLHFTDELRQKLISAGINFTAVTLHVGAGTFLPVKTENIHEHKMHTEWGTVSEDTVKAIQQTKATGGRVIAVGTTSLRIWRLLLCIMAGWLRSQARLISSSRLAISLVLLICS